MKRKKTTILLQLLSSVLNRTNMIVGTRGQQVIIQECVFIFCCCCVQTTGTYGPAHNARGSIVSTTTMGRKQNSFSTQIDQFKVIIFTLLINRWWMGYRVTEFRVLNFLIVKKRCNANLRLSRNKKKHLKKNDFFFAKKGESCGT